MKILDNIYSSKDIKKLNIQKLKKLTVEIREFLVDSVSETGGHLASNLGVVELTLALHKVFDFPNDSLVFDVGHQSYVHKLLTGRKEEFNTLRKYGGVSGFPKREESDCDAFSTGHAGDAISVAYGIAEANKAEKNNNYSIALTGDASLANGLSFEGLNNAGTSKDNLIVILNDNEMSISKNVGNLTEYLTTLRTAPGYNRFKYGVKDFVEAIPVIGSVVEKSLSGAKNSVKKLLIPGTIFEQLGFNYIGPVDGHDIERLITILHRVKNVKKPVFLHVVTKKGKGYSFAEKTPTLYHGVGKFDKNVPLTPCVDKETTSYIAGNTVTRLAKEDKNIVAICAAMEDGCGFTEFHKNFPERFYDVGISEGHAVTFAAGLATKGKIPVVAIYSTFMQRAYDNILHDMAINKVHSVLLLDRAGISGEDGETHQGIFDINYLRTIPNVTIFTPYTKKQLEKAIETAIYNTNGVAVVRYFKGKIKDDESEFDLYKPLKLRNGTKATLVTYSKMTAVMENEEFDADHFHLNCVSDIDYSEIFESVRKTKNLVIAEDSIKNGGVGEKICTALAVEGITAKCKCFAIENEFVPAGSVEELLKHCSIDSETIARYINETEA